MMNPYEQLLPQIQKINKTQQKICDSFVDIYKDKAFEDITIKVVCKNIPIARSTFYQYFNNVWEVKDLIENNFIAGLLKSSYQLKFFDYNSQVYVDYLNSILAFLKKNKLLFYILLVLKHDASFIYKYKISILI